MQKLFATLFVLSAIVATNVAVMIYGWGLEPKSWWWIIGAGIFANTVLRLLGDKLNESDKKPAETKRG